MFDTKESEHQVQKSQKPDPTKQMGELLLKGWKMLAETCFECYCPLMKSKQGVKLCCGCDRDYSKPAPVKANESKANKTVDIKESEVTKDDANQISKQLSHKKVEFKSDPNEKLNMYEHLNEINIDDNEEFKIDDDLKQNVRKNSYKKHCEEKHGTISSTQIASENSTPQKQCGQPLVKPSENVKLLREEPQIDQTINLALQTSEKTQNLIEGSNATSLKDYEVTFASSINRKIEWLCKKLEQETDLEMINRTLDVISKAQKVVESLK